ncbi:MAG: GntR family transcriptional regulator [Deltaproteobacteria bacterium]|nr:MAG: GntR family transcriptional regulator [Deltaproteobacteria bacterium]
MASPKKDLKKDFHNLVARLENMILTGVFQPRERLVELNLANELEVSRFWVRDAFKILETKGLIKVVPYKGAMVCDLDEQEIEDIFEVRTELDALATRKAAENVQKSDINFLKRMAQKFEESVRSGDFGEMISANENFHDYIYELAQNQTLIEMIRQLKARGHILRYHAWASPDIMQRIWKDHKQLIKGLENKDVELLDELAKRHISYSKDSYLLHLNAKKANFNNNT